MTTCGLCQRADLLHVQSLHSAAPGCAGLRGLLSGLFLLLPEVNLHVPPPLVTPGKLSPALVAGERFLPSVRADVRGEVVTAAEVPHTDAALEGFVASVDAQVPAQFV